MRAKVESCVFGVMGEELESRKSSELTMCPLTSLITTSSPSDKGSVYPRRILLSFLRLRLFGKEEPTGNQQQAGEHSHHSSAMRQAPSCNHSHITPYPGDGDKVSGSSWKAHGKQRHHHTMQHKGKSEIGGKCNTVFSQEQQSSHKSCAYCSLNSSHFAQNDNQYSLGSQRFAEIPSTATATQSRASSSSSSSSLSFFSNGMLSSGKSSWCSFLANKKLSGVMKMFHILFLMFILLDCANACGPGRGAGRRRAPRKLPPLVYKQHVPNVPENTLSASGFTEGRITRKDPKFKNLVPNYNPDITFRDEEGTGADRLMTQRCKEKLNTLAISVMNQWPGVKLRVIEGWDEELHHATHSLHYEGRAVDITTSDKDRSKYGMLARLAAEAGFDWVYYESRAHIHCSVKSDSSQASRTGGCFSANATIQTPTGPRRMEEISIGDKILTIDSDGKEVFSDVLMFLDRNTTEVREFFEVTTESGATLTLTPSHLLYSINHAEVAPDDEFLLSKNRYLKSEEISQYFLSQADITFAKFLEIGDWLLVKQPNEGRVSESDMNKVDGSSRYVAERVIKIEAKVETGVFAPLTSTGNLVVDGVLTSCYALIQDQSLAHLAFAPVRLAHNFRQSVSYLWKEFSRLISFGHVLSPSSQESSAITNNSIDNQQRQDVSSPVKAMSRSIDVSSEQGIHWYASFLYSATRYILPSSLLYD